MIQWWKSFCHSSRFGLSNLYWIFFKNIRVWNKASGCFGTFSQEIGAFKSLLQHWRIFSFGSFSQQVCSAALWKYTTQTHWQCLKWKLISEQTNSVFNLCKTKIDYMSIQEINIVSLVCVAIFLTRFRIINWKLDNPKWEQWQNDCHHCITGYIKELENEHQRKFKKGNLLTEWAKRTYSSVLK